MLLIVAVIISCALPGVAFAEGGLKGEYYDGKHFEQLDFSRVDSRLYHYWNYDGPGGGLGTNTYSVRWRGSITAPRTATYQLYLGSDDGARVWINGKLVISDWYAHAFRTKTASFPFKLGVRYQIRVDYYEDGGNSAVTLGWSNRYMSRRIISNLWLTPPVEAIEVDPFDGETAPPPPPAEEPTPPPPPPAEEPTPPPPPADFPTGALPSLPGLVQSATCNGVQVSTSQSIQSAIDANPNGTTFCLASGTHRISVGIIPKSGNTIVGMPGAVLSGAKMLTEYVHDGTYWYAPNQTQRRQTGAGQCAQSGYAGCTLNEAVHVDNVPLWRVMSRTELRANTFFFDFSTSRIYFGSDPRGHSVEASIAPNAIIGHTLRDQASSWASNVTVRGLVIEKFGNMAQHGVVHSYNGTGWLVENNEIRFNHSVGVCVRSGGVIRGNLIRDNGQLGICGQGNTILVENNEIGYNNWAGYESQWEAGGAKWAYSNNLTVRNNYVHHNKGPGLWTDIDNINSTYDGNVINSNDGAGIYHEISYDAIIKNNYVSGNGMNDIYRVWAGGAGIHISASPNVEVFNNTVTGNAQGVMMQQQNRGAGTYGEHKIRDVWVHDNKISFATGKNGLVQDVGDSTYFTSRNVRFTNNDYTISGTGAFEWNNGPRTALQWRGYGHDLTGTFN